MSSGSFSGTVPLNYTALSQNGTSYSGTVYITVSGSVSAYFDDVTQNYVWAADAIDYLYKHSVVSGTDTDIFSPGSNIRRGDFVLMLVRAFSLTATDAKCSFTDVAKGSYYYDAIAISEKLGISQGSGGKFNPMATLTRQDAMVLVKRTLDVANIDIADGSESDLRGFTDNSSISAYARDAAADLVKAGVIIGTDNKLNPSGSITRAELAVILYRILSAF
ncbi:MAG: S-layer homology domain-containing protein [Bacillota bacterium]|nr:S-layer homology domain-containing protein [Bacillota bacterium]